MRAFISCQAGSLEWEQYANLVAQQLTDKGFVRVTDRHIAAAPICGQQRAPRWWLIGRSEDGTHCKIVVIWRPLAFDLVGRNIWTPRRNFAV